MFPFAPLVGQSQAVALLSQAVERQRIAPAYLFAGPTGVGRNLAATCFIELLFGHTLSSGQAPLLRQRLAQRNHPDLLWVEPTYLHQGKRLTVTEALAAGVKRKTPAVIRLEQIREIAQFLSRSPLEASRSVVVIEAAETMAEGAANGLLKTLEEPGQATLILIAPGAESLLPTLVSRCQRIPFYRLSPTDMADVLQRCGHAEILQQLAVLQLAQGSPGAAIAHWQQLQTMPPDLMPIVTRLPQSPREALSLARQIDRQLEVEGQLWLIDYLQQICWQHRLTSGGVEIDPTRSPIHRLEQARQQLLSYVQPRLVWEVTLLGMV